MRANNKPTILTGFFGGVKFLDFDKEFEKIKELQRGAQVLLHCCCAPCTAGVLGRLQGFKTECFYFNPNIMPFSEYEKRLFELKKLCRILDFNLEQGDYQNAKFLDLVKGLEDLPEGVERCEICFRIRLSETAKLAKLKGFDYFCTTLTLSPHKNTELINKIGFEVGLKEGINYLPSDFKKQGGYQKSIELCKEYGIYRQNYCGCRFDKKEDLRYP